MSQKRATDVFSRRACANFILVLLIAQIAAGLNSPVVEIDQGKLEGKVLYSRGGREFYGYFGVPFAKAERFQPPRPAGKWEGVLQATEFGPECVQSAFRTEQILGAEDCLNLQVFTTDFQANLPVLVFIHGGAFTGGSGNQFGPEYMMDSDVVLVTINYRLGALGFLSTGDEILPGNNGLKDQSLALKWVQDNIAHFGGNPFSVTIMGHSAGSASVSHHILSPLSKGLFHGAVPMAGTSLNPWAVSRNAKGMAKKLGEELGCDVACSKQLFGCLQQKTALEIILAQQRLNKWGGDPVVPFGPVIEPDIPGAFLSEEPRKLLEKGTFNHVPVLQGTTEDEGITVHAAFILNNETLLKDLNEDYDRVLPLTLMYDEMYHTFNEQGLRYITRRLREYYFANERVTDERPEGLINIYSDRFFHKDTRKFLALLAKHVPVYNYIFSHNRGDHSTVALFGVEKNYGVGHGDEMGFLFREAYGMGPEFQAGSAAEKVSKQFVRLCASFVKHKTPTALWGPELSWSAMTPEETDGRVPIKYYVIDRDTTMVDEPWTGRAEFWDKIFKEATEIGQTKDEL